MIDTVAPTVNLSDPLAPYEIKPSGIQLTLLSGGTQITFSGDIRVRTTTRPASSILNVQIVYKDRTGGVGGTITTTTISGTATGFDDSFTFYGFSANIPATTSISSFTVVVVGTGGLSTTYANNGAGFPIQDSVIALAPQSCLSGTNLTGVAAVRTGITSPVSLGVSQKVARTGGVPVPALSNATVTMVKGATIGPYSIYSGSSTIASAAGTKYGVSSGLFADDFKDPASLGATCAPIGTVAPSSTSSSVVSTSQSSTSSRASSTTSSTAVPTPVHKPIVGKYSFQGCFTEGTGVRALADAAFVDYANMTSELCASKCDAYVYWGIEYYGECYCGNELAASSTQAPLGDCSFICPGNPNEYCGAGNRLELYKLTSAATSSRSSSSVQSTSSATSVRPSSSVSSRSSTAPTSTPTLAIKPVVGSYVRQWCYTEGNGVRALSGAQYVDYVGMTLEICAANCAGTAYFGVEYGGECYCGQTLDVTSVPATNQLDCSFICPGDASEYCGAGNRLELYKLGSVSSSSSSRVSSTSSSSSSTRASSSSAIISTSTTKPVSSTSASSTAVPTLRIVPSAGGYNYLGCYTEGNGVRALSAASFPSDTNTVESCVASCAGFKYAGMEYGRECWCADEFGTGSVLVPNADCSMTCAGDQYEYCGAGNRLQVYQKAGTGSASTSSSRSVSTTKPASSTSIAASSTSKPASSSTKTSTSSATPQVTPAIKPTVGAYSYNGCQTEATGVRALTGGFFFNETAMTLEMCASNCAGFKYWGVEYGAECYCGNEFQAGSVTVPHADCSFLCPGNALEYCGAGNRLSSYVLTV